MTLDRLIYGDEVLEYEVFERHDLSGKIAIHVHPNGTIQVDRPERACDAEVRKAVRKRARWIKKQKDAVDELWANALSREYVSGETHFYLGRRHRLKVEPSGTSFSSVKLALGRIVVQVPNSNIDRVRGALKRWYLERANDYLSRRLETVAAELAWVGNTPKMRLVGMRRQWGNCSPNGDITLNPALVKAPRDCIDYVLTHELCHLREHHHGPKFYELLGSEMPDWKAVKGRLDGMAELLLA